jgi:hypothetical protein
VCKLFLHVNVEQHIKPVKCCFIWSGKKTDFNSYLKAKTVWIYDKGVGLSCRRYLSNCWWYIIVTKINKLVVTWRRLMKVKNVSILCRVFLFYFLLKFNKSVIFVWPQQLLRWVCEKWDWRDSQSWSRTQRTACLQYLSLELWDLIGHSRVMYNVIFIYLFIYL